ncbi:MAG: hypothetical protein ACLP7P_18300 [Rhodomicrobium sp.]
MTATKPTINPVKIAFRNPKGFCGGLFLSGDVDIYPPDEKIRLAAIHMELMLWPATDLNPSKAVLHAAITLKCYPP